MNIDELLESFEQAWRNGPVPDIASELDSIASADLPPHSQRTIVNELIMIDLWHRWQPIPANQGAHATSDEVRRGSSVPPKPVIDDYVNQFP